MKCEKCARELPGNRVICPDCGFNNAAQRVERWKAQRQLAEPAEVAAPESKPIAPAAAKIRARYEAKLLQFPTPVKTETEPPTESESNEPSWRELARSKVREHQQRRAAEAAGETVPPPTEDPTTQLLVESALKRIRRTQPPPVVRTLPRAARHTRGGAVARALDYDDEPLSVEAFVNDPPIIVRTPLQVAAPMAVPFPEPVREYVEPMPRARVEAPAPLSAAPPLAEAEPVEAAAPLEPMPEAAAPETPVAFDQPIEPRAKKANVWIGKPAPIWLRALAGSVDLEAAALAYLPFFGAYTSFDGVPGWGDLYLMASILAVVMFLYQLITYSFNGRTVGMALCGLRCVDATDASTPITFKRRMRQALGGTIGLLCPPFNFVVTRVTEYQRGLADALGGTITLRRAND